LIRVTNGSGATLREYIYLDSQQIAFVNNGTLFYVHNDHLNTPQVVTNQNQQVVWMADYQPFGKLATTQTNSIELYSRFPGQYLDGETGLFYNYFRDYDPSIGRYIQSDPIGLGGGINTYAYVGGNPIARIDPTGEAWFLLPTLLGGGGAAAGGTAAVGTTAGGGLGFWGTGALLGSGLTMASISGDTPQDAPKDCPKEDKSCPPCNPPVGTIRYRVDMVPPSVPHHPHTGSHVHLYKMNQNPKNCQCFWQPVGTTELPPPGNASPMN
jgi:RHS repeat-associated protein